MDKKKRYFEIGLILVILVMTIFTFVEISKTFENKGESQTENKVIEGLPQGHPEVILKKDNENELGWISLDGDTIALSDFIGTPLLVNFWASWCPPCLAEMPLLQEFAEKRSDEVVVLAINAGEDEATVKQFAKENDLKLTILLDPSNSASKHFRVYGFPTTLFMDEAGSIQSIHIGELDEELLIKHLAKIGIDQ